MDLYRDAKIFPKTLDPDAGLAVAADLPGLGISKDAASWRVAHARIQKPYRGIYVPRAGTLDLLARVRAALTCASPDATAGFYTAAALLGFGVVESDRVHLIVPAGGRFPQRPGIAVHRPVLPMGPPTMVHGVPCSPAARTAVDIARVVDRYDGLATLDAALFSAACTPDDLATELILHKGLKGSKRAQALVPLADHRPACRQETRLRLILLDAGFTTFEPQVPIWDSGEWPRYFLDLGDRQHRVGAEYDGASHVSRDRIRGDRARHNFLSGHGWTMRYFTDLDIYRRPRYVVATITAAMGS